MMRNMSKETQELLRQFATTFRWNTAALPSQMGTFLDFVIAAYKAGEHAITQEEFLGVVGKSTTQREIAIKLYMHEQYRNGIQLLKRFEDK